MSSRLGRSPTITFVGDHLIEKQRVLREALESGDAVIALSGPSKSGKTVLVEREVGKEKLIHVTGSGVDTPGKLWERVFDQLGASVEIKTTEERGSQEKLTSSIGGDALAFKGLVQGELFNVKRDAVTRSKSIDHLQLLIRDMKGTDKILFIDDFHYISREAQVLLAQQIKEAIRQGVIIICASVPYHSDDVLRANPDFRGRIVTIDVDYWQPSVLRKIAEKGFNALHSSVSETFISALVGEAAGSPQLMQALCLNACLGANLKQRSDSEFPLPEDRDFFRRVCARTAMSADYSSTVEKMKDGPKTRGTERKQYRLKNGDQADVYPIVLRAASQDPPTLTHRYKQLGERISQICQGDEPSGSSVIGACEHIASIANSFTNAEVIVIEWDPENDVLDIRDPYLMFYLRWSEFEADRSAAV
jgi:hypothetical protein